MATQTTAAAVKSGFQVEVSTDNVTWIDISGEAAKIDPPEQERVVGTAPTAAGDVPIVKGGKRKEMEIPNRIVYTEESGEAYEVIRAIHEGTGHCYYRYAPKGGAEGNFRYTACDDAGSAVLVPVSNFIYPDGDADSADIIMSGFTVTVPALLKDTVPAP